MRLDVKLIKTREMMCNEAIIATIVNYFGRHYEMMFSEMWKFDFLEERQENHDLVSSRIIVDTGMYQDLVRKYHGIRITNHSTEDAEERFKAIEEELKNKCPVSVVVDAKHISFATPADVYLGLIVIGIDYNKKEVTCLDVHLLNQVITLSIEEFQKGCLAEYYTFQIVGEGNPNIDWKEQIKHNIATLKDQEAFKKMRLFADALTNSFDVELESSTSNNINTLEINNKVKTIYRSRVLYAEELQYLIECHGAEELKAYQEKMIVISNRWLSTWSILIKSFMQDKVSDKLQSVSKKVLSLADMEESLCEELANLIKEGTSSIINNQIVQNSKKQLKQFCFVDLSSYLNNEGFSTTLADKETADLSQTGQFLLTKGLPKNEIWKVEGVELKFSYPVDGKKDNISCASQVIPIEKGNYSSLIVLACAEWGHQCETLEIQYEEERVKVPFEISDWSYTKSDYEEIIAWEGNCAEKKKGKVKEIPWFKGHLFVKQIPLDESKILDSITLPECENIHIFAMTLGK